MDFIRILLRESPDAWRRTLIVAGVAGIGNAAILAIINRGAAVASGDGDGVGVRLLLLFLLCMAAFYFGKRYSLIQASVIVEHMVRNRLVRVIEKIRRSELEVVENLARGDLYARLAQNTSLVSHSGIILVNAAQQSLVLIFCLLYIAWLSKLAFVATLCTIAIGVVIYVRHARSLQALMRRLTAKDAEMVDTLGHMVDGFKEVRLNRAKSDAVSHAFARISRESRDLKIDGQVAFCTDIMFSDLAFYMLLAVVVFVLPRLAPTYGAVVLMTTAAILFIIGPLQMVVQAAPVFERAKAALANLTDLEDDLDRAIVDAPASDAPVFSGFSRVTLTDVRFTYGASSGAAGGFSVGPVNLSINRGEMLFLVGGNGSGKTTLLKVLTGLYLPQQGALAVDGVPLGPHNVQGYRELFSTVFTEFHLFDRLYGLDDVPAGRVDEVLASLELSSKTHYENGRFSTQSLSTGQRKRLALAVCLLERRDILVFDEWAADQDPHFRKHFYEVILPGLKAEGFTIIATTHDDRYWHLADRVVRMEDGTLVKGPAA